MRILIAVHGYPPTHTGGAERRAARTARQLAARGHEVRVFCVESAAATEPALRWADTTEGDIIVRRLSFNPAAGPTPFQSGYDNPAIARALTAFIREWQPELVHLFSGYLLSASVVRVAKGYGLPLVVSLTDYWWLCHRITLVRSDGARCAGPSARDCARCHAEQFRRFRLPARAWPAGAAAVWQAAERSDRVGQALGLPAQVRRAQTLLTLLRQADALIAPSHYLAGQYLEYGLAPERMHVWRQGVELDRCPVRTPDPALRVGYIGQMKHHKGVHLLLDAWAQIRASRPHRLMLYGSAAGEEAYGQRLHAMIAQLENVTWAGAFRGAEVWQILSELDLLVVPSRWVENSPNSILEAQAVGVPIVGTNLGGIAEMVQHGRNGLLFATDDSADLARQLQRLLDEPDLLGQLRQHPLPFQTLDNEIEQIISLYQTLRPDAIPSALG